MIMNPESERMVKVNVQTCVDICSPVSNRSLHAKVNVQTCVDICSPVSNRSLNATNSNLRVFLHLP
jgi:hypothetical protein